MNIKKSTIANILLVVIFCNFVQIESSDRLEQEIHRKLDEYNTSLTILSVVASITNLVNNSDMSPVAQSFKSATWMLPCAVQFFGNPDSAVSNRIFGISLCMRIISMGHDVYRIVDKMHQAEQRKKVPRQ